MFTYKTSGVCATEINVEVKNNINESVEIERACPRNLIEISQ